MVKKNTQSMKKPKISQVWKYKKNEPFTYPEMDDAYKDFFEGKEDFGISFSGGGTRSATCTMGQLRGLHAIGVLDKAKYIASNSGGTWGSLPYIYFKGDLEKEFFGEYIPPEKLTIENVTEIDEYTFLYQITQAYIFAETFFKRVFQGEKDESFSLAIANIFLRPLKIGYTNKLFTLNDASFNRLKENNPNIEVSDFELVTKGRPFHIANGTLHNWKFSRKGQNRLYHVEMTPLYAGIKTFHPKKGDSNQDIGGGYVDPFAFDSIFVKKVQNRLSELIEITYAADSTAREKEFTLADVMGISGSAASSGDVSVDDNTGHFPSFIYKGIAYLTDSLPEIHHFSPNAIEDENIESLEYNTGDGGPVDDIALMPLLARGIPKILCFCNVQFKVLEEDSGKFAFKDSQIDEDVLSFFGLKRRHQKIVKIDREDAFQKVFPSVDFWEMLNGFKKAMTEDKPLIYEGTHKVLPNEYFGIKGGYRVKIMWFYNERCKDWEDKIDKNIFHELGDTIGEKGKKLKNFPNFKTFSENVPQIINMYPPQVTLLSNYQTWIIHQNKQRILDFLFNAP